MPAETTACPIALALKRKFHKDVDVDYSSEDIEIQININDTPVSVPLKEDRDKVSKFINNFDDGDTRRFCRPFKFLLEK